MLYLYDYYNYIYIGIGLMELIFEPNLKNGNEAAALVNELILILRSIGVCSCEMEGSFTEIIVYTKTSNKV